LYTTTVHKTLRKALRRCLDHEVAKIHEDAKRDGHEAGGYPNAGYLPGFDQALISVIAAGVSCASRERLVPTAQRSSR
jgi:hypothetical protein